MYISVCLLGIQVPTFRSCIISEHQLLKAFLSDVHAIICICVSMHMYISVCLLGMQVPTFGSCIIGEGSGEFSDSH